MEIVFLLTHIPDPRMNKRILLASECGNVSVVCTRRKSQNVYEPALSQIEYTILDVDLPSSKHLLKRYVVSQKYQKDAYRCISEKKPDLIYAEGLDSLIIANKYKNKHPKVRIFFEVADLRECFVEKPKSFVGKVTAGMIAKTEKRNFKAVERLIVTSMKFFDMHYSFIIDKSKVIFMPNVPDPAPFKEYKKKTDGEFTVGFIGGIRYLAQMKMLVNAAEQTGCRVLFAGAGGTNDDYDRITAYCKGKDFVTFSGKYDYNSEIASLYGQVDCVYSVYDASNPNVRIALPNKLYEAVYCELPIIVAKGTYLSEIVAGNKIGMAVEHRNEEDLVITLDKLKNNSEYRASLAENCKRHRGELLDNNKAVLHLQKAINGGDDGR